MNLIQKAGIVTGAVIGGTIGGTLSVIGKVSKNKFIDELGESIVDSTILTGKIAGTAVSGAGHMVTGKLIRSPKKIKEGSAELKEVGNQIIENVVTNFKTVTENGGEIFDGIKKRDRKKVVRSTKTLVKVIAVGAITVGAIRVKEDTPTTIEEEQKDDEEIVSRK